MKHLVLPRYAGRTLLVLTCCWLAAGCLAANLKFVEDPGEGDYDVSGKLLVKTPSAFAAQLAFSHQDKGDHYLLTVKQGQAKLARVSGGQATQLGNPAAVTLPVGSAVPFTVQRRQWRIALVLNGKVVLRAYDSTLGDGKVGSSVSGGSLEDLAVQPVGGMELQDDFVREEGAESVWEPAVGTWEAKTLRDDEQAAREEADKSANAFSYFGSGEPRAISLAGNWFWDRYSLEAAVKPTGRGAAGLAFYYQDPRNYLVLRLTCEADPAPNGNKLQLVLVRDGEEKKVLAEKPGGYSPGQFYKLRVQVCEDLIACSVDDEARLQVESNDFGQGRIGLYAEGKSGVFFDDVSASEWEYFRESFNQVVPGKWRAGSGFKQLNGALVHTGGPSQCLGGPAWERYACSADATLKGSGSAGVLFGYKGAKDYCLLKVTPAKAQLLRVSGQGSQVLAEKACAGSGKHRLRVSVEDGLLSGSVDGQLCLQAVAPGVTGGGIGLAADGSVSFDNLTVTLLPARRGSHVTKEFTVTDKHPEMAAWASTRAPWVAPAEGADDWWTKGDYFGDTGVNFTIPAVGGRTGTARAVIGGEPGSKAGTVLTVAATEKSKKLALTLSAGDETLKTAEVEVEGDARVVFSRESGVLVVRVNDQAVLAVVR